MTLNSGKIVVHRGRAHVDDFLASCVCLHKTDLVLCRMDLEPGMLEDPRCWVLDQGMRFEPEMLNFDHHHLDEQICSLTMVLDHFYGKGYRTYIPQLSYIEIHDSMGSSKAAKFAGVTNDIVEKSASLIQHLILKSFSEIEGEVTDPFRSVMCSMGSELCGKIEALPLLIEQLENNAKIIELSGLKVLDLTLCETDAPDQLPTKYWCEQKGISLSVILTRDSRCMNKYRMISTDGSVRFRQNSLCSYTHPSGFLTVFDELEDWKKILAARI